MSRIGVVCCLVLWSFGLLAEEPSPLTAKEIMSRVAVNQDREQAARNQFVYEQHLHRAIRNKGGKLLREEFWKYDMAPSAKGTSKKVVSVKGRYWKSGKCIPFEGEPVPRDGFVTVILDDGEVDTKDGLPDELFPLTTKRLDQYVFERGADRVVQGRPAYSIKFGPGKRDDYGWSGEATIDQEEFQPISVYTRLSRKLPLAVRTLLGTDVPGLGYNVSYTRVDKDIWFPSSYGTEFGVKALFLINRTMTESTENTNFKRVAVDSRVEFDTVPTPPESHR